MFEFESVAASKIVVKNYPKGNCGHGWCYKLLKSNEKTTWKNWEKKFLNSCHVKEEEGKYLFQYVKMKGFNNAKTKKCVP